MRKKCFALIAVSLILPVFAEGQTLDKNANLTQGFYKAWPLSMGGAWRALSEGANAITMNPAGLAFNKANGIAFDYEDSGYLDLRILSGTFFDTKSLGVATGLAYDRMDFLIDTRAASVDQFTIAFAKSFKDIVYVGNNFKYFHISRDISAGGDLNNFSGDLGITVRPLPQISTACVFENIYTGTRYQEIPFILSFGSAVILGDIAKISIDTETNFSTKTSANTNYYFGAELTIAHGIFFRSGFGLDRVRDNPFFGTGISFTGPKLYVHFTFSERLDPVEQTYALSAMLSF